VHAMDTQRRLLRPAAAVESSWFVLPESARLIKPWPPAMPACRFVSEERREPPDRSNSKPWRTGSIEVTPFLLHAPRRARGSARRPRLRPNASAHRSRKSTE
jgi:hypothetical protein